MVARFGAFSFDSERRQLTREGDAIHLTRKAFDLLAALIAEAPRVVTKSELHERLWTGTFVSDATLVGLVKELRRALDDRNASTPIVRTSHGVGYAFAAPLEPPAAARFEVVSRWLVAGDVQSPPGVPAADTVGLDSKSEVFVGRGPELERLEGFLRQAVEGAGRVVFITGEAGIGKTALADEFLRRARRRPSILCCGRCSERDQGLCLCRGREPPQPCTRSGREAPDRRTG
jgi:DNA-binding winged helix-turn-helix (wHTH) protein